MNDTNRTLRSHLSPDQYVDNLRKDGWIGRKLGQSKTTLEVLNDPPLARSYIMPGIVAHAETTLVHVSKGVNIDVFAMLMAYCCAYGKELVPFGWGPCEPTLYCVGRNRATRVHEILKLITERDPKIKYQGDDGRSLRLLHRFHDDEAPVNLCSRTDQGLFLERIPTGIKLIVFQDIGAWMTSKAKLDDFEISGIDQLTSMLNSRGIAVLAFSHAANKTYGHLIDEADHVQITPDLAGLTEIGGSFLVTRHKESETDNIPLRFRFWHSINDGRLDWCYDMNTNPTPAEGKAIAMKERQIKVAEMLRRNMPQKEIAVALGVDAATICRDAAKLQATDSAKQREDDRSRTD